MNPKRAGGLNHNPLLTRTEPAPEVAAPDEARTPVGVPTRLPSDMQASAHVHKPTRPLADTPTRAVSDGGERASKFTFYFTEQQLERLDAVWEQLRRRGRSRGQRPSKSQFVRVALNRLLDDFERDPEAVIQQLSDAVTR